MKRPISDFEFVALTEEHLPQILDLQERVIASMENPELLRKNTAEMFLECVQAPNLTIGVFVDDLLVAVGVLYVPDREEEDLAHLLVGVDVQGKRTANNKLCMVDAPYRGNGLQVRLGQLVERRAKEIGVDLLCATVSPLNPYSENNVLKLGFTKNRTLEKYGSPRNLFYKFI